MRTTAIAVALLALLAGGAASAQQAQDKDWPCDQRKVPHLYLAQMWSGPAVPTDPASWNGDPQIAQLVDVIAARRTSLDEVSKLVSGVSAGNDRSREDRLLALWGGVFEAIDGERARIIDGIDRYAEQQKDLAAEIGTLQTEIDAATKAGGSESGTATAKMADKLKWQVRVFEDRRKSLRYVCESPVTLEKRAFAVGKIIQNAISGG